MSNFKKSAAAVACGSGSAEVGVGDSFEVGVGDSAEVGVGVRKSGELVSLFEQWATDNVDHNI